jgi:hypothetical protein
MLLRASSGIPPAPSGYSRLGSTPGGPARGNVPGFAACFVQLQLTAAVRVRWDQALFCRPVSPFALLAAFLNAVCLGEFVTHYYLLMPKSKS